ncbi:hypothetical protein PACTADRAFT_48098 [Pachysolen tannophilus NRRL Y-2460]|uniref:INO80 complex subunit B-like conserved region domain-containing protein n=1 Tax=Pachysolen tannophilus NRRL Y-2460 TaxID=669874 RepID=A0A1E4U2T1_PACTA|nr:hypothetical protein PACTADRAFT_48098 [Pachysolen tannophilus NRRL Y-2460]
MLSDELSELENQQEDDGEEEDEDEDDEEEEEVEEEEEDEYNSEEEVNPDDDLQMPQNDGDDDDDDFDLEPKAYEEDELSEEKEYPKVERGRKVKQAPKLRNHQKDYQDDDDEEEEDEEEEEPKKGKISLKLNAPKKILRNIESESSSSAVTSSRNVTNKKSGGAKREQSNELNDEEEDEEEEEEEEGQADIDQDLLLTDEEEWELSGPKQDISKMTERQRAKFLEENKNLDVKNSKYSVDSDSNGFLELSNEPTKKKVYTEEELQLRRAETARKRKNLSERRLEEEKQDTLNRLLKRRANKVRDIKSLNDEDKPSILDKPRRPVLQHKALISWRSTKDKFQLIVPDVL